MRKLQIHKRLNNETVGHVLNKYCQGILKAKLAISRLGVGRTRFYELVNKFKNDKVNFSINYRRQVKVEKINNQVRRNILLELKTEKEKIVDNPEVPTKSYNYSYLKNLIREKYSQTVSLPTVIRIAKDHGFYQPRKKPTKKHDREVVTNYVGELVQHDSSHHLFSPVARVKWYLITSLDDFSRSILYGGLFLKEGSFVHIKAVEETCLQYGIPFAYYVDQHSIFRYVRERDKFYIWKEYNKFTDDVDPQFKMVLNDLGSEIIYALSPEAKGKVERPYHWLQDHLVRSCVRYNVNNIDEARKILKEEIFNYNFRRIHSTTGEIPMVRFNQAIKNGKTLFKPLMVPKPYESTKDIFALRLRRMMDGYRSISVKGLTLKVPGGECYTWVELRLIPDFQTKLIEIRFWQDKKYLGLTKIKIDDLPIVHY